MNKEQFLSELNERLKNLPPAEIESAINYYDEYFLDASPGGEGDTLSQLGSPSAVASKIIGEFALGATTNAHQAETAAREDDLPSSATDIPAETSAPSPSAVHPKGSAKTIWIASLAVLASPIALPIGFAVIVVVASLVIALAAIIIAFGVSAIALIINGVFGIGVGLIALFHHPGAGLFTLGVGAVGVGCGILLGIGVYKSGQFCLWGIQKALGTLLTRKAQQ